MSPFFFLIERVENVGRADIVVQAQCKVFQLLKLQAQFVGYRALLAPAAVCETMKLRKSVCA